MGALDIIAFMPHDFMPGLAGVPAARSRISDVDGQAGVLEYRGIRIEELTAKSTFLETAFLLLFSRLPTRLELERFTADITRHRRIPDRLVADILDVCLILHAEHTMNASTFCGLVTASTLADPYTVVASAIGALKGPLHGGANEEVVAMLREIGTVERVRPYLQMKLDRKEPIMGFGHRVDRKSVV